MTRGASRATVVHLFVVASVASTVWVRCAAPTAIRVDVHSEIACGNASEAALVGGKSLADLVGRAPTSTSTQCIAAPSSMNALGDVVLRPQGSTSSEIAFQVMVRNDKEPAETCLDPSNAARCIVARRQIHFSPQEELRMRVDLRLSCLGVVCPIDQTCVRGRCVGALVPASACKSSACDETSLSGAPTDADAGVDGGDLDASVVTPPNATLAAGARHTCTVTSAGTLKCWGFDARGQLGNDSTTSSSVPVDPIGLTRRVLSVAAGGDTTCVLTELDGDQIAQGLVGGRVQCFGANTLGQLGNDDSADRSTPVDVVGLTSGVASVEVGELHSCAVLVDGGVRCWGRNTDGQLGNDSSVDSRVPVEVNPSPLLSGRVSGGGEHSCALRGPAQGAIHCWGNNIDGRLGNTTAGSSSLVPVLVGSDFLYASVSAGHSHTCAITIDGRTECWGGNSRGQLGDGTQTDRGFPRTVFPPFTGRAVASGGNSLGAFSCAVTTGGAVKCWGHDASGQLGTIVDGGFSTTAVDVEGMTGGAVSVVTGHNHACALMNDGRVKCWGHNGDGQLGNNSTTASPTPVDVLLP